MPAYFHYGTNANQQLKVTKLAYNEVIRGQVTDLRNFIPPLPPVPGGLPPAARPFHLGDGVVLMCGTTAELSNSLNALSAYFHSFTIAPGNSLCIHYAMIRTGANISGLICLASLEEWWKTNKFEEAGSEESFKYLSQQDQQRLAKFKEQFLWLPLVRRQVPKAISITDLIPYFAEMNNRNPWVEL